MRHPRTVYQGHGGPPQASRRQDPHWRFAPRVPHLPIHVHTHDTAPTGVASMIACAEAGADAVDAAIDSMSGMTSQPSFGAIACALEHNDLKTGLSMEQLTPLIEYWESVRFSYSAFESGQKSGSAEVYTHEMPGGQREGRSRDLLGPGGSVVYGQEELCGGQQALG